MSPLGAPPTSPSDPVFVELQKAFASGDLTLFVGAGISAAAGLPGWKTLVEKVVTTVKNRGADAARLEEIDELLKRGELIDALTAAKEALGSPVQFGNLVQGLLDDTGRNIPEAAEAIAELSPNLRAVLTTNLDRLLERALRGNFRVVVRPPGDLAQQRRYLLHLHGTLHERDSWVMTREDYDRAMYANPQLQGTFSTLFHAHPLLFLGFGLADDNFDAVFARVRALAGSQPPRHFALVASETVTPSRRKRLEDSGLNLIVYANPDGRHSEVARILRQLAGGTTPGGGTGASGGSGASPGTGPAPGAGGGGASPAVKATASASGWRRPQVWVPLALGTLLLPAAVLSLNRPPSPPLPTPAAPHPSPPAAVQPPERSFAGLVTDEKGKALQGVDVSLPFLGVEVQTDKFGHFQFSGIQDQELEVFVRAQKAGYRDFTTRSSWGNTGFSFKMMSEEGR